jgi:hypothetical protein
MSSPHVAGVAALVKQAHPTWDPDMIRTALINTATNMRNQSQVPVSGGLAGDSVNDQGGGLVDVFEAVHAKALMGVAGDGINAPTLLGSHSYGEVPVANSRVMHTTPVTVTIRDVSGQGGTYNLSLENNRDLQLEGIDASLSATTVTVAPNGTATFAVNALIDGEIIRSTMAAKVNGNTVVFEPIQMQWYVTATRADGGESLRMPFYLKPAPSLPASPVLTSQHFEGVLPASDAGLQTVADVTYQDIAFDVSANTYRIEARLDYLTQEVQDVDFYLLDPDGQVIASSAIGGGPEELSKDVQRAGTYKYRVVGFLNGPVTWTINGTLSAGPNAPTVQTITGDFVDSQGRQVDFDGSFTVNWQPEGHERSYEIERSTDDGQTWEMIATAGAGTTSLALTNQPNGTHSFRVRGLHDGQIGFYVTPPSNAQSIVVDLRAEVTITNLVKTAISNVSLANGVFQLDLRMTNQSSDTFVPLVRFNIVRISSASGTVRVINADNGGGGTSTSDPALFDYSRQLGSDEKFSPGETTGPRTMRFQDDAAELFSFEAVVTAFQQVAGAQSLSGSDSGESGASSASTGPNDPLLGLTGLLRFTVNPITGAVAVNLVSLN